MQHWRVMAVGHNEYPHERELEITLKTERRSGQRLLQPGPGARQLKSAAAGGDMEVTGSDGEWSLALPPEADGSRGHDGHEQGDDVSYDALADLGTWKGQLV